MSELSTFPVIDPAFELRHRLARALEIADLTNEQMAEVLGVSTTTIRNYVSGRTSPKDGMLRQWALRCGVPYQWLKTGEVDSITPNTPGEQGNLSSRWNSVRPGQVLPFRGRSASTAA